MIFSEIESTEFIECDGTSDALDILTKNTMMSAGVLLGGSTAVAAAALVTAALPAQMLSAAAVSGALIYAGDRKDKGLPINPFSKEAAPVDTTEVTEASA